MSNILTSVLHIDNICHLSDANVLTIGTPNTDVRFISSNISTHCGSSASEIDNLILKVNDSLVIEGDVKIKGSIIIEGTNGNITFKQNNDGQLSIEGSPVMFNTSVSTPIINVPSNNGINLEGIDIQDYIKNLIIDSLQDPNYSILLKTIIETVIKEVSINNSDIDGDNGPGIF
jgi:hypothetical protein